MMMKTDQAEWFGDALKKSFLIIPEKCELTKKEAVDQQQDIVAGEEKDKKEKKLHPETGV